MHSLTSPRYVHRAAALAISQADVKDVERAGVDIFAFADSVVRVQLDETSGEMLYRPPEYEKDDPNAPLDAVTERVSEIAGKICPSTTRSFDSSADKARHLRQWQIWYV